MQKSDSIKELASALAKAQGEIENASKNSKNDHFKNRYADLAEVLNTVRPVLAKHGLSVVQFPSLDGGIASVETIMMHESGEWLSNIASAPLSKPDAQGVGSVTTYLRRYSLAALAGVAQEDDDANGATGAGQNQRQDGRREFYSDEQFNANLPTWQQLIESGKKTAEQVIATVESKAPLTTAQKRTLNQIKKAE